MFCLGFLSGLCFVFVAGCLFWRLCRTSPQRSRSWTAWIVTPAKKKRNPTEAS